MSRLHQLHRWTGLIAGPLLILIAFSGAALLFRQDVERAAPRTVAAAGRVPLDIDELARRVTTAHPGSRISYVQFPEEADAPFEIVLLLDGTSTLFLAVDLYTGSALGPVQERNNLMSWAGRLHSSLFLGQTGRPSRLRLQSAEFMSEQ